MAAGCRVYLQKINGKIDAYSCQILGSDGVFLCNVVLSRKMANRLEESVSSIRSVYPPRTAVFTARRERSYGP